MICVAVSCAMACRCTLGAMQAQQLVLVSERVDLSLFAGLSASGKAQIAGGIDTFMC